MKTFFTDITSIFHKKEGHEAWFGHKYVLVLTHKKYDMRHDLGSQPFYKCVEFKTKEEAMEYLDEYVPKAYQKECKLYKEIGLSSVK